MKKIQAFGGCMVMAGFSLIASSCAMKEVPQRKPVPPQSTTSNMPWNTPVDGQGAGQMGMLSNMMQGR